MYIILAKRMVYTQQKQESSIAPYGVDDASE